MKKLLLNAAVAAALASAGAAHAVATQVNFGFGFVGDVSYTGLTLGSSTQLDFGTSTFKTNTVGNGLFADDSGVTIDMPVTFDTSIFNYIVGQTTLVDIEKTFTTAQGTYTTAFTSVTAESIAPDFLALTFQGTITGPGGFSAADVMLANCNQAGGAGLSENCSFTEQGPPRFAQVPEPATLSLVGLSLFGLLAASRRRRPR